MNANDTATYVPKAIGQLGRGHCRVTYVLHGTGFKMAASRQRLRPSRRRCTSTAVAVAAAAAAVSAGPMSLDDDGGGGGGGCDVGGGGGGGQGGGGLDDLRREVDGLAALENSTRATLRHLTRMRADLDQVLSGGEREAWGWGAAASASSSSDAEVLSSAGATVASEAVAREIPAGSAATATSLFVCSLLVLREVKAEVRRLRMHVRMREQQQEVVAAAATSRPSAAGDAPLRRAAADLDARLRDLAPEEQVAALRAERLRLLRAIAATRAEADLRRHTRSYGRSLGGARRFTATSSHNDTLFSGRRGVSSQPSPAPLSPSQQQLPYGRRARTQLSDSPAYSVHALAHTEEEAAAVEAAEAYRRAFEDLEAVSPSFGDGGAAYDVEEMVDGVALSDEDDELVDGYILEGVGEAFVGDEEAVAVAAAAAAAGRRYEDTEDSEAYEDITDDEEEQRDENIIYASTGHEEQEEEEDIGVIGGSSVSGGLAVGEDDVDDEEELMEEEEVVDEEELMEEEEEEARGALPDMTGPDADVEVDEDEDDDNEAESREREDVGHPPSPSVGAAVEATAPDADAATDPALVVAAAVAVAAASSRRHRHRHRRRWVLRHGHRGSVSSRNSRVRSPTPLPRGPAPDVCDVSDGDDEEEVEEEEEEEEEEMEMSSMCEPTPPNSTGDGEMSDGEVGLFTHCHHDIGTTCHRIMCACRLRYLDGELNVDVEDGEADMEEDCFEENQHPNGPLPDLP